MSNATSTTAIVGEPEVVEDAAWLALKAAASELQASQMQDGSIPDAAMHAVSRANVETITRSILHLAPRFAHDAAYLEALVVDFERWANENFGVPDFLDSLNAFLASYRQVYPGDGPVTAADTVETAANAA